MDANSFREPPLAGDEIELLLGILDRTRKVSSRGKCSGLDASGLRATLGPSAVTLGGLLKHLALVEDHTFSTKLFGRDPGAAVECRRLGRRPGLGVAHGGH